MKYVVTNPTSYTKSLRGAEPGVRVSVPPYTEKGVFDLAELDEPMLTLLRSQGLTVDLVDGEIAAPEVAEKTPAKKAPTKAAPAPAPSPAPAPAQQAPTPSPIEPTTPVVAAPAPVVSEPAPTTENAPAPWQRGLEGA